MIRWTPINQLDGFVIQADSWTEDTEKRVEIRIPYDVAIKMITEGAEALGLIDKQKEKLKKLMQFLLEVL